MYTANPVSPATSDRINTNAHSKSGERKKQVDIQLLTIPRDLHRIEDKQKADQNVYLLADFDWEP